MAYESAKILSIKGNVIKIVHPTTSDQPSTYLSAALVANGTALTVLNSTGFADKDILLIGKLGHEQTEFKQESGAPGSVTAITVAASDFAHAVDTPVSKLLFDQVEISGATTATGSKTVIATVDLQVDAPETTYVVTGTTYAYYFVRYYNSLVAATYYGGYSDAIAITGYADNTVRAVKTRALEMANETIGNVITNEFLNTMLFQARRDVHNSLKRWSFREQFDYDAGNLSTGDYYIALPTDLQDPYTNKNILGVRIENEDNIDPMTKAQWDSYKQGVPITTLASNYTVGDANITLTDSRDFDDSGSIQISTDTIVYSANTRATGVLTISTDGSDDHTAGDNIFQGVSLGTPQFYTVFESILYFWPALSSDYDGRNIWLDYYKTVVVVNSDADTFDELNYDMYVHYLAWAIKKKKDSRVDMKDGDYIEYSRLKQQMIDKEISGQRIQIMPQIDHLSSY